LLALATAATRVLALGARTRLRAMSKPRSRARTATIVTVSVLAVLCLPCIGAVAALGVPAYVSYVRRSKTAEASAVLQHLFVGADSYYESEHIGADGAVHTHCTVEPAITPNTPSASRSTLGALPPSFEALGFPVADPVYFQYEIASVPGCDHPPGAVLYSFRAHGDLDGDGTTSLFELSAGTGAEGELIRAPDLVIENELE
jgi:hypothetical protein